MKVAWGDADRENRHSDAAMFFKILVRRHLRRRSRQEVGSRAGGGHDALDFLSFGAKVFRQAKAAPGEVRWGPATGSRVS